MDTEYYYIEFPMTVPEILHKYAGLCVPATSILHKSG